MPSDPLLARAERKLYLRATDPTDDGDHPWASLCADLVAALRSESTRAERAEAERDAARSVIRMIDERWGPMAQLRHWTPAEVAEIHAATRQPQGLFESIFDPLKIAVADLEFERNNPSSSSYVAAAEYAVIAQATALLTQLGVEVPKLTERRVP